MKIELNTATLKNALKLLARVKDVSRILVKVVGNITTLSKSNADTTVNVSIEGYSLENGCILLPIEIADMVKNLREPYLTISDDALTCERKIVRFNSEIPTGGVEEFHGNLAFSTSEKELHRMLEIKYAMGKDDLRPILCGIAFKGNEMCAMNNYTLALRVGEHESASGAFVVNKNTIEILQAVLNPKSEEKVNVYVDGKVESVKFEMRGTEVIGRIIPGEFMNYKQIIPDEFRYISEFKAEDLKEELDYIKTIKTNHLNIKFEEKQLTITTNQCKEELDAEASNLRTKELKVKADNDYKEKYKAWADKKSIAEKKNKPFNQKCPEEKTIKPQKVYKLVPLSEIKITLPCQTELKGESEFNIVVNKEYLREVLSTYTGRVYMKMNTHVSPIIITKDDKNLDLILPIRIREK